MTISTQYKVLSEMTNTLDKSLKIYHPSAFWQKLNLIHMEQLRQGGIENFKYSINTKYFNWGILGILRHQLAPIFYAIRQKNTAAIFDSRIEYYKNLTINPWNFAWVSAFIYKIYIAAFSDYLAGEDALDLLGRLQEPLPGNPIIVRYKNRVVSQDLCNSIHEFYSITRQINLKNNARIAEIGAGYGRLAYVFLKTLQKSKYTIIDIPPALFISQTYLSSIFSARKIFKFQPFTSFTQIKLNYEKAKIAFLLPNQFEKLPPAYFDLIINISSLHEMTQPQINNYFKLINKIGAKYFYTKQWRKSRTRDNQFIEEVSYPVPSNWKTIFQRKHPVQSMFFEALYKIH